MYYLVGDFVLLVCPSDLENVPAIEGTTGKRTGLIVHRTYFFYFVG
jgi:hypothetical protein